jgi:peptidoglycan-associated lipoprotein
MKQLAYSLMLTALLAGCAGTPSQEAAIEDRGIKAAEAVPTEGARIVEATRVETKGAASAVAVSESAVKPGDGVQTSASVSRPITEKSVESVETRGLAASTSEVKPLPGDKDRAAGAGAGAAMAGGVAADGKVATTQEGSALPKPDTVPSWGDLTNPESPLSKRRVMFDFDSSAIRDEYRPVLEAHARFMSGNKEARGILQGHADERGSREYNLALGQRRAESVLKALNLLGVPELQMEAVSFGEEKPIAEGHDEEAWQQNRRVEVLYQGE